MDSVWAQTSQTIHAKVDSFVLKQLNLFATSSDWHRDRLSPKAMYSSHLGVSVCALINNLNHFFAPYAEVTFLDLFLHPWNSLLNQKTTETADLSQEKKIGAITVNHAH